MRIINAKVNYPVRYETLEGKNYCIVPVIALVEGVHIGSGGAAFYSAAEISKFPEAWNGRPIPVLHPEVNGEMVTANSPAIIKKQVVGQLFNMTAEDAKLKGEMWIDVVKANAVEPKIMQAINNQTIIEVSTAFFSDAISVEGEWNGEKYDVVVSNIRPDHVALLPGQIGACSVADGCGLRENINLKNKEGKPIMKNALKKVAEFITGLLANEISHDDIREKLWQWCDSQTNQTSTVWLEDVYDDYFVHSLVVRDPSGNRLANKLYKRAHTVDENGAVVVSAEATEVIEKKEYVPVATPAANTNKEKESIVDKKQKIDALIACNCTKFEEGDREFLNGLTDNQLDKLGVKEPEKKEEPPKVNAEQPPAAEPAKPKEPMTTEAYVNAAPPDVQAFLNEALETQKTLKAGIVKNLLANKANAFTEAELNAMSIPQLKKLAAIANVEIPEADYSGQAGGPTANVGVQYVPMEPAFKPKE